MRIYFSTMSSSSRLLLRLILIVGPAVLAASVGICYQALRITGRPQEFRSMAKIVVTKATESPKDFYSSQLESAELKSHAMKRVKALNPDLKETDVAVRTTPADGSGIISILATGTEPKYTRLFLDALLDEFLAMHMTASEKAAAKTSQPQDQISVMERASPASENVEDWRMPVAIGAAGGALLGGLAGFLLSLFIVRPRSPQPPAI